MWTPLIIEVLDKHIRRGERARVKIKYRWVAALFDDAEWVQSHLPLSQSYTEVSLWCHTKNLEQFPVQLQYIDELLEESKENSRNATRKEKPQIGQSAVVKKRVEKAKSENRSTRDSRKGIRKRLVHETPLPILWWERVQSGTTPKDTGGNR